MDVQAVKPTQNSTLACHSLVLHSLSQLDAPQTYHSLYSNTTSYRYTKEVVYGLLVTRNYDGGLHSGGWSSLKNSSIRGPLRDCEKFSHT